MTLPPPTPGAPWAPPPPPGNGPLAGPAEPLRPSAVWYGVGGALIVAGIVGAVVWIAVGILGAVHTVDDFQRVPAPGEEIVTFDDAGGYTLYDESPYARDASSFPYDVTITPVDGGAPVVLEPYGSDFTYDFGGHEGRAFATFHIDRPGRYRVVVDGGVGPGRFGGQLALGPGVGGRIVGAIVGGVVIGGLGFLAGAGILVVTAIGRSRDKQRRRALSGAGAGPPPPWAPQGPTPPWPPPVTG